VVAVQFGLHGDRGVGQEDHGHHGDDDQGLLAAADEAAEHEDDREREHDHQQQAEDVREPGRVLERMRAAGAVEAAAVRAQQLDDLHGGDWAAGDLLGAAGERAGSARTGEVLHRALADQHQGTDHRKRNEHPDQRPGEVRPEVADPPRAAGPDVQPGENVAAR
jgi:hypothetical protein